MVRKLSYASSFVNKSEIEQFFFDISELMEAPQLKPAKSELERFASTVTRKIKLATAQEAKINKIKATRFNVFNLIEPDENKLSDILAGLLDPHGDHGQGDLFLRLFFKRLGPSFESKATKNATIQREAPTHGILKYRRRIDILIDVGELIAIENKVDSPEQTDQVKDYLEHLSHCTRSRSIQGTLIYLTPEGKHPVSLSPMVLKTFLSNRSLYCWSYAHELRTWLDACCAECKSQKICCFLADFIGYIETKMNREPEDNQEAEDNEE
jgi:hypothetical protein